MIADTHVFVWLVSGDDRLGAAARQKLEKAAVSASVQVAAISLWEIAMLVHKGRLALGVEAGAWIAAALALPGISLLPLLPSIALDSVRLPGDMHADPADRMIVASARHLGVPLVTADRALLSYSAQGHVLSVDAGH